MAANNYRTLNVIYDGYTAASTKYMVRITTSGGSTQIEKSAPTVELALVHVFTALKIQEVDTRSKFLAQPLKYLKSNASVDISGNAGQIMSQIFGFNPEPPKE